ncbi:MAG: hypothetical protein GTO22_01140, partial [Gemmatimonadales bacterium]|nr:hypothetical protein [Gemmatimonadales bacterium]
TSTVTVTDTTPPMIIVPPDLEITCKDDPLDLTLTGEATCEDNCDSDPTSSFTDVMSGSCPVTITRTWCCVDDAGNMQCEDQVITVVDNFSPMLIGVPDDTSAPC